MDYCHKMGAEVTSSVTDPDKWTLPDPKRVLATLQSLRSSSPPSQRRGSHWTFSCGVAPVDFYTYLKWRFWPPNGFAMTLRSPSVDNWIHWNYTLECPETILDIMGLNTRMEIHAYEVQLVASEWNSLESRLLDAFKRHDKALADVRRTFEHWQLFVNPYQRLASIVERYEKRLKEITIPQIKPLTIPTSRTDADRFGKEMTEAIAVYEEVTALCVNLQMIAPVMGEAAVNFVFLVLAKPGVRNDQRVRDDFARGPIDVRIKTLHLFCDEFADPITGSEDPFKNFLRLMNRRNDALHGNIDPRQTTGEEVFFDFRTIPLFPRHRSFGELALASALGNLTPKDALDDVKTVRAFVDFLLSRLVPSSAEMVGHVMKQQQLGYRADTGRIGAILPEAIIDFTPGADEGEVPGNRKM